jgi:hypothetical protein
MFTLVFFFPSPISSVFFFPSLVYTDQNPVTAYEPIGRQLGGCHGDTVGGACARCTTNLLRFEMGVTSTSPPSLWTYELTNAQISHVTASVARRGGTAQKQKCCRPFSGRAVSSAKGFYTRHLAHTAPPLFRG